MVRNYKPKKPKISAEVLAAAIKSVKVDGKSMRSAAIEFKIPRSTLQNHCKNVVRQDAERNQIKIKIAGHGTVMLIDVSIVPLLICTHRSY